jgi:hypothetical protein
LDEQRAHDVELSQLDDDILHHIDSKIEDIIAHSEQVDSDDDNSNHAWYQEQPGPSDNDIDSDNDSELTPEALIDAIIENTNMSDIDDWVPETIALMVANPVFTILREANYNALVYFADGTHRVFLRSEVDEARQLLASFPPMDVRHANVENSAIDNEHNHSVIDDNYSDSDIRETRIAYTGVPLLIKNTITLLLTTITVTAMLEKRGSRTPVVQG